MNTSAVFIVCVILISHSPLLEGARVHGQKNLVGQICMKTLQNEKNCMELLQAADPKIMHAKNFRQLSKEVLDFALKKGIEAQNVIKGLAQLNNNPAIVQCANFHYDGVVMSFRGAMNELKDDPQTANYDAKVASDGSEGCERALAAANIVNPVISALNREITLLSNIAFEAINGFTDQ